MQVNPYLMFDGRCAEAFKFYEQCLGARTEVMMTARGTPMEQQAPADRLDKIMHGRFAIGSQILMASDAPPDGYEAPRGFSICLGFAEAAEAERAFHALADGGTVQMAIQETFWAVRFGMLVDRFGIPWMINCERPRP
jgi:PhnB protein